MVNVRKGKNWILDFSLLISVSETENLQTSTGNRYSTESTIDIVTS